jgi:hypothetical protein
MIPKHITTNEDQIISYNTHIDFKYYIVYYLKSKMLIII